VVKMRGTIYTCTVQSGRHSYQITDLHRTVIKSWRCWLSWPNVCTETDISGLKVETASAVVIKF